MSATGAPADGCPFRDHRSLGAIAAAEARAFTPADFIRAARVPDTVEAGRFGAWLIERRRVVREFLNGSKFAGLFADYTILRHDSWATLHLGDGAGAVVMEDSPRELQKHLPIWLAARSVPGARILITGLGLGCVVRGLLALPTVAHVDVVELDKLILERVGAEFRRDPRVTLVHDDALLFAKDTAAFARVTGRERWDLAWHDLWIDDGGGDTDRGLQALHAEMMVALIDRVGRQGAWAFPRWARRRASRILSGRPE